MYNNLIKEIVTEKCLLTIIIDMERSSNEELETLSMIIKDIKKQTKIILNNGNKSRYMYKDRNNMWYSDSVYNKIPNIDLNFLNIFIIKDRFLTHTLLTRRSGFILNINDNELSVLKSRTLCENDKYDIKLLLRREKIKKLNK